MYSIDLTIDARGFAPTSIALAVRTIGACPAAGHRPDARLLYGVGTLTVTPEDNGHRFSTEARCLGEEADVADLLDWLETQIPATGALISWDNWGSVPRRFLALADPERHPRIRAAAADTAGRWRDLPRGHTWSVRQSRARHLPCLCPLGTPVDECEAARPAVLLPCPEATAIELVGEAIAGWQAWARIFGDFDDADHPAQAALRALDRWRSDQRSAR